MTQEYLWAGELGADKKEVVFNPSVLYGDDLEEPVKHSLLLKRITLGPLEKFPSELNVVEIESMGFNEKVVKTNLCSLQATDKLYDSCCVDLTLHGDETMFRLVQGSGPISILAQHLVEITSFDDYDEEDDEEEEEEGEIENGERVFSLLKGIKRKITEDTRQTKKISKVENGADGEAQTAKSHGKLLKKSSSNQQKIKVAGAEPVEEPKVNPDVETEEVTAKMEVVEEPTEEKKETEPSVKKPLKKKNSGKQVEKKDAEASEEEEEPVKKPVAKKTAVKQRKTAASKEIAEEKELTSVTTKADLKEGDDVENMKKPAAPKEPKGGRKAKK